MVSGRVECGSLAGIFLLAYGNDCRLENPFQNENLPFYVVELADFLAPNDPGRAAWAELRKQQAKAAQESPYVTLIKIAIRVNGMIFIRWIRKHQLLAWWKQ